MAGNKLLNVKKRGLETCLFSLDIELDADAHLALC